MQSYPLPLNNLRLTIDGVDRTEYLLGATLRVNQILGSQVDTCRFQLKQPEPWRKTVASIKPTAGQEVVVELQVGSGSFERIFGGTVQGVDERRLANRVVAWEAECTDFTNFLGRRLVNKAYTNTSTSSVVQDLITNFAPGLTTTNLETNDTIVAGITFNYLYVSECLDRVAKLVEWEWYIDYDGDLHFFEPGSETHPSSQQITDTSGNFMNLAISPQLDQVRNRVFVMGGESLSDFVTEVFDANGVDRSWTLQNEGVTDISITIDGATKTIGRQGDVDESDVAFMLVQDEGGNNYVRNSAQTDTVEDLAVIKFTYRYKYPIAIVVEDLESQATIAALDYTATDDGVRESIITNNEMQSIAEARALGQLELARWSTVITDITFHSYVAGWKIGDTITVNVTTANTGRTFSGTALIQNVTIVSGGNRILRYEIECRSARFNLIDYYKSLLFQRAAVGVQAYPSLLNLAENVADSQGIILIDAMETPVEQGAEFYVAPDWGTGTTPYGECDFSNVSPTSF